MIFASVAILNKDAVDNKPAVEQAINDTNGSEHPRIAYIYTPVTSADLGGTVVHLMVKDQETLSEFKANLTKAESVVEILDIVAPTDGTLKSDTDGRQTSTVRYLRSLIHTPQGQELPDLPPASEAILQGRIDMLVSEMRNGMGDYLPYNQTSWENYLLKQMVMRHSVDTYEGSLALHTLGRGLGEPDVITVDVLKVSISEILKIIAEGHIELTNCHALGVATRRSIRDLVTISDGKIALKNNHLFALSDWRFVTPSLGAHHSDGRLLKSAMAVDFFKAMQAVLEINDEELVNCVTNSLK